MEPISKQKINQYILYIYDNINELKVNHRKEVLQIILGADIDPEKVVEKGNGTQIKFADMDAVLLQKIYNYIYNKLETGEKFI